MSRFPRKRGEAVPFFNLRPFLTSRHKRDGQDGAPQQEQEEQLAQPPAQAVQGQQGDVIGREGDGAEENLEQENIAPQVLEVQAQAVEGYEVGKSVASKRGRRDGLRVSTQGMHTMVGNIVSQAAGGW